MMQQHFFFRKLAIAAFAVMSLSAFSSQASEQSSQSESAGRTPAQASSSQEKRQSLSFEDELVEGSTQKPELFFLFQKKNFNYKRLIRLRENFLPEMRQTSEDLQRGRSSN